MFNAQYYIDKFTPIPEDKWCITKFHKVVVEKNFFGMVTKKSEQYCAQGHCMGNQVIDHYLDVLDKYNFKRNDVAKSYPEWDGLIMLFKTILKVDVADVNNGACVLYQQLTPKQRILKALEDIKKLETKATADTIIEKALQEVHK